MSSPRRVTLLVLGQTGAGKSELLNAYLEKNAFETSEDAESVTLKTSSDENLVKNILRAGVDTQSLNDTQGVDATHVQQMIDFLRQWEHGVDAIGVVIDVQETAINIGTQKLIRIVHEFLNNPNFWDHVCIIFTRCFAGHFKRDGKEKYRNMILRIIEECSGPKSSAPHLPMFFVDSPEWRTDQNTQQELIRLHAFAYGKNPLPTQNLAIPDVEFMKREKEYQRNYLLDTLREPLPRPDAVNEWDDEKQIKIYIDREREKLTAWDGYTITYSEWKEVNRRTDVKRSHVILETSEECIARTEHGAARQVGRVVGAGGGAAVGGAGAIGVNVGSAIGVFAGPLGMAIGAGIGALVGLGVGWRIGKWAEGKSTRTMQKKQREIRTDFDGKVSFSDWRILNEWTEELSD